MHSIYINNISIKIKLLEENAGKYLYNSREEMLLARQQMGNTKRRRDGQSSHKIYKHKMYNKSSEFTNDKWEKIAKIITGKELISLIVKQSM